MSEHLSIHDLLDDAVRDHTPLRSDPYRAVVARGRTARRRAVGLGALAIAAVVTAGVVLGPAVGGNDGSSPAAPGITGTPLGLETLSSESAAESASRAEERRRAEAAAGQGFRVTFTALPLVIVPPGWTRFTPAGQDPEDMLCSPAPRVVYQVTVGDQTGPDRPCYGAPAAPYLWNGDGVLPDVTAPVEQDLRPDGSPRWVQTDLASNAVDVYFPQSGQFVRAVGLGLAELEPYLTPAGAPVSAPLVPEATPGLSVRISFDGGTTVDITGEDASELSAVLRRQPAVPFGTRGSCFALEAAHWQLQVLVDEAPSGFLVVDAGANGCGIAASSYGGLAQVDESLLALLTRLTVSR